MLKLRHIWLDPVWSKVIAGAISAIAALGFYRLSTFTGLWFWAALACGILTLFAIAFWSVALLREVETPAGNRAGLAAVGLSGVLITGAVICGTGLLFVTYYYLQVIPSAHLILENVRQVSRGPVWDQPAFNKDEIVTAIHGQVIGLTEEARDVKLLAFWRLANDISTNWHVGKRRVGDNYALATLDGESAIAQNWDFLVGGIEVDKTYSGIVSLVVVVMKNQQLAATAANLSEDNLRWGFSELPTDGRVSVSAPVTFETKPTR